MHALAQRKQSPRTSGSRSSACGPAAFPTPQIQRAIGNQALSRSLLSAQAGSPGDRYEREADRAAERVLGAPEPAGAAPSHRPAPGAGGSGQPLDPATRSFMEPRFGHDFSQVRIHTGREAAESARAVDARAFTVGRDIVFDAGRYAPATPSGRSLLAHELAHVVQQGGAAGRPRTPAGGRTPTLTQGLQPCLQRQPAPPAAAPPTPGFTVNQAAYLRLVNQALGQMSGRLVDSETLSTTLVPILQAMLGSVTWKDAQGNAQGGGAIRHALGGGVTLNLHLILNDAANPRLAGEFTSTGATDGEMEVFIANNPDADELAVTLFHEGMHLISWLINRPTPALTLRSAGRSGPAGAARTLDLAHAATQIANVRLWLDALAQNVNPRRAAAAGTQISAADLDSMARWLVEEINVRIETEVFRQVLSTQRVLATRGPMVIVGSGQSSTINAVMVDRYVFDLSHVFLPTDRAGLNATDRQSLATLLQILDGIFQNRVSRRFNPSPYLSGRGIAPQVRQWTPPPLTPPTFRPLPTP